MHLFANVRRYFGLDKQQLARYLGVSLGQVSHIEAGRRALTGKVLLQLNPLALLVPATLPPPLSEAELAEVATSPAPGPLEARRDYCIWKAG